MDTIKVRLKKASSFWDPSNKVCKKVTSKKDFIDVERTNTISIALVHGALEEQKQDVTTDEESAQPTPPSVGEETTAAQVEQEAQDATTATAKTSTKKTTKK